MNSQLTPFSTKKPSLPHSLKPILSRSFTTKELKVVSRCLNYIIFFGLFFHSIVLIILIIQQLKKRLGTRETPIEDPVGTQRPLLKLKKQNSNETPRKPRNNYVTFAFVFHQVLIDFVRIFYCCFYSNGVEVDSKKVYDFEAKRELIVNATSNSVFMYNFYQKYCVQMALVYSVLNMVTIINILTILISETCRFYDLKLSSSDTSNYCCVLFGIILIWMYDYSVRHYLSIPLIKINKLFRRRFSYVIIHFL